MSAYAVAALLCYTMITGWVIDRLLARARWVSRHPRHAVLVWHASALACMGGMAGVALLLAHDVLEHSLLWLLHADKAELHLAYAGGRSVDELWNLTALLPMVLMISVVAMLTSKGISAERRRSQFRLLPRTSDRFGSGGAGVVVVDHAVPAAHCLPGRGRGGLIVLTSAAVAKLTAAEVEAALEHERAHLRLRHHHMILMADSIEAILSWSGALRSYSTQVRRLAELDADDAAAQRCGRRTVASALLAMCTSPPGPHSDQGSLAFSGSAAAARIRRLLEVDQGAHGVRLVVLTALTWSVPLLMLVPPAVVLWPAVSLAGSAH